MRLGYHVCFLVFFIALLFSTSLLAQPNWQWNFPKPQGNSLFGLVLKVDNLGVAFGDLGTVLRRQNGSFSAPNYISTLPLRAGSTYIDTMWVVGDSGLIFKSVNNGSAWVSQAYSGISKANFYGTAAWTKDNVWVVGDSGFILYSTNGGTSFAKQSNSSKIRLRDIAWAKQTAYAVGDSGVLLRGNFYGGQGWAKFATPKKLTFRALAMDTFNVFAVGDSGYLLRHDFIEQSTVRDTVLDPSINLYDVAYYENYVIAVGSKGVIKRSVDTGATWTTPTTNAIEAFYHVELASDFATSGVVWAVGENGIFMRSANFGQTWTRLDTGNRGTVYAGGISPNGTLYATSGAGFAYRSTNAGTSWKKDSIQINGVRITDIAFDENGFGLAATYDNKVLKTLDSGKKWTSITLGNAGLQFLGVAVKDSIGIACGTGGAVYRTKNKGNNWTNPTSNTTKNLYDVDMWGTSAIAVGESGGSIYSNDQGSTWTSVNSGTVARMLKVGFMAGSEKAVAIGQSGTVLHTSNRGSTWVKDSTGAPNHLNDVRFHDDKNGIIVGDNGTVLRTTNGGVKWSIDTSHTRFDLKGAIITSSTEAYLVGSNTTVLYTSNSALPVELLSLSASRTSENAVAVRWSVASESNNMGYAIDRLSDDSWKEIGFEKGEGTMALRKSYTYHDEAAPSSLLHYRLRQIDLDGAEHTLGTLTVAPFGSVESLEMSITPIPSHTTSSISFSLPNATTVSITFYDMTGRTVMQIAPSEYMSGSYSLPLDVTGIVNGEYMVELRAGASRITKKIIITH